MEEEAVDQQSSEPSQSVQNGISSHVTDPEDSGDSVRGGKSLAAHSIEHGSSEGEMEDSRIVHCVDEGEVLKTKPVGPPKPAPESEEDSDDRIHFRGTSGSPDNPDSNSSSSGSNHTNPTNQREDISPSSSPVAPPESSKENETPPPPPSSSTGEMESGSGSGGEEESSETSGIEGQGSSGEIPAVTHVESESQRTGESGKVANQTSFVNEYALNSSEISPMTEVDRKLEQFSEILLDSDASHSDEEPQAEQRVEEEATSPKTKGGKRVRFADEVTGSLVGGARHGQAPPPSNLPDGSKHSRSPIKPSPTSPTSPKQKVPYQQYTVDQLIHGVELEAEYLGSTPIILNGLGAMKSARMFQAQQAVQLIKDPENESRPHFAVKLKVSTGAVRIADTRTDVDLMDHPLHTITYVADIDRVLVIMAHVLPQAPVSPASSPADSADSGAAGREEEEEEKKSDEKYTPKMTCHVLDTANARQAAMVIGQAFSAAYKQFLRSSGISEQNLEQAEYAHILNAQSVPKLEVESLGDRNKIRKLTIAKHKNDLMGMMVIESGYGSAIPACVIVHLSKTGSATRSGLLNIGDHIISINGVNLVGMPRKACIEQIKKCRYMNVVRMEVCSCPAVVDVTIVRPDLKFQLGFSVHEGMICSLVRASIAERSGVRVGHRIIDINGTSTVGMRHADIVHLLSSTVGDLHIRMMPDVMYKLLTGKLQPEYF